MRIFLRLWDVMSNEDARDFIFTQMQATNNIQQTTQSLVEEALQRGSSDNITAVVVSIL